MPLDSRIFCAQRRLRHLGIVLCALGLLGATPLVGTSRAQPLTQAEEIAEGRRLLPEIARYFGSPLPASSPLSQRVARIGRRFAALSQRKGIPYSYQVLDNEGVLNAFSLPGGPVFITSRLVKFTHNDAELAAILGHETGHIEHRDGALRFEGIRRAKYNVYRTSEYYLGRGFARNHTDLLHGVAGIGYVLATLGNSREAESAADETGTRWMARLGYDPRAIVTLFRRMEPAAATTTRVFLRTHPPTSDRETRLLSLIRDNDLLKVAQAAGGPRLWDVTLPLVIPKQKVQQHTPRRRHFRSHRIAA